MYYTYVLISKKNNQLYISSTNNLKRRLVEHNSGKEISTKRYMPWGLFYYEAYKKESLARIREKRLKFHGNSFRELKKRIGIKGFTQHHFYCPSPSASKRIDEFSLNNKLRSKSKSGAGFTLAEVLIVITIILLLFPMVLTNYNAGEKQFSLYRSAHGLAQELRNTQEMAMTGKTTPVEFGQNFPAGGYGLYFEDYKNSYILFADCDGDNEYDESGLGETTNCLEATPAEPYPEKLKEFSLESGVIISNIIPSEPLTILFFPPTPIITINPQPSDNQAIITLELADKTKTITINTVGLIDVD